MTTFIALLQGVNVGKYKRIAMTDLKRFVIATGGAGPVTVANSGNVVFTYTGNLSEEHLRQALEDAVSDHVGTPVPVILRSAEAMRRVIDSNPYPDEADPKKLHVEFLLDKVEDVLSGIAFGEDDLTALGSDIYLHLPNGMSGMTYDARTLFKRLDSHHTSRNWNTVTKLAEIASSMA